MDAYGKKSCMNITLGKMNGYFTMRCMMEKWALMVGVNDEKKMEMESICVDYGISIHFLSAMTDAVEALANRNGYLLIVIMLHPASDLFHIQTIRSQTNAPIIVLE